jgi:sec-independent protein translocase protein TatA
VNLGSTEILLIVLVILLLFGPSQIPKMARGFGQAIREFKKAQREIGDELEREPRPTDAATPQSQPPKGNGDNKPIN